MSVRWAINSSTWHPSAAEFDLLLQLLPPCQRHHVLSFVSLHDRKRALVSRLLQAMLLHRALGVPYDPTVLARTPQGKPVLHPNSVPADAAHFSFNVAHHGNYVVIASEPSRLVGVDITSHDPAAVKEAPLDYVATFRRCFTQLEWEDITARVVDQDEMLSQFYRYLALSSLECPTVLCLHLQGRHWSMKEAYVKAVGLGLAGFHDLQRIEFFYPAGLIWAPLARMRLDGKEVPSWSFSLQQLNDEPNQRQHWVCVAKGPDMSSKAQSSAEEEEDGFQILSMEDIVPQHRKLAYLCSKESRLEEPSSMGLTVTRNGGDARSSADVKIAIR